MNKLKTLWQLTLGGRRAYTVAIIALITSVLMGYLVPIITQYSIDNIIGKHTPTPGFKTTVIEYFLSENQTPNTHLLICAGLIILVVFIQGLLNFLKGRYASKSAQNSARLLKNRLFDHIQRLPYSYYSRIDTGDLVQRCSSDVETYSLFMETQSTEFFRVVVMIIAVIPLMLSYSVETTIAATLFLPIIIIYSFYYFVKMKTLHRTVAESEALMSTVLQENLTGVRVVKAFAQQEFEVEKFDKKNCLFKTRSLVMIEVVARYWAISAFFCMLQIVTVLIYGVIATSKGELQIGEFVAFMTYEGALVWTIRGMGRILGEMGKAMVSFSRINEVLKEKQEVSGGAALAQVKGDIEFNEVSFSYPGSEVLVLDRLSFKIKAGETVAFVGPTGSGKSTLVNLLPRLYDASSGVISLDGKDITNFDRHELRQQMGMVQQEPFLYSKTIEQNVATGAIKSLASEQIEKATKIANIHKDILTFNDQYETEVGERGVTLSGGQKQRLAISRAIIEERPIVIFDDALSAVDAETDNKIRTALEKQRGESTRIIVSHRMSTVCGADKIYVLEHGKITESGSHQELLAKPGLYSRLWHIQKGLEV